MKLLRWFLQENNYIHTLGAQMQNVDFVETGFTSHTDFIVVQYSITNTGLLSDNFVSKVTQQGEMYMRNYMECLCTFLLLSFFYWSSTIPFFLCTIIRTLFKIQFFLNAEVFTKNASLYIFYVREAADFYETFPGMNVSYKMYAT